MECTHCGSDMCDGRSCYDDVSDEQEPKSLEYDQSEYRITGTMRFLWTEDHTHVFGQYVEIKPFPSLYTGLTVKSIDNWLSDVHKALGRSVENKEIEIIVRVKNAA